MSSMRMAFAACFLTSTLLAQDSSLPVSTDLQERNTNHKEISFGGYSDDYGYSSDCSSPCNKCEFPYFSDIWPCTAMYGSVEAGYKEFRAPRFNFAANLPTGRLPSVPFDFYTKNNQYPDGPYFTALVGFELPNCWDLCFLGSRSFLEFAFGYWRSQDLNDQANINIVAPNFVIFPALQNDTLQVVFIGPGLVENIFTRNFDYIDGEIYLRTAFELCFCNHNYLIEPFLGAQFNKFTQQYGMSSSALTGASASVINTAQEHVRTNYYDFGGGIKLDIPICNCLSFDISAGGYASYGKSHLHANQTSYVLSQVFTSEDFELTHNEWSGKFKGSAGLGWRCCHALLTVVGNYEYWGYMPQINNPFAFNGTPGYSPTHLTSSYSHNWSVGLRVSFPMLKQV